MCVFVTLILPTDDAAAVRAMMARHGRAATPLDNVSVRRVLRPGERQFLTTAGPCDCGSVLANGRVGTGHRDDGRGSSPARGRQRDWPPARVARAEANRLAARQRPRRGQPDGIETWEAVLRDVRDLLRLPHAGLLVRVYAGAVATEAFTASRRTAPPGSDVRAELLALAPDAVTIFPLRP